MHWTDHDSDLRNLATNNNFRSFTYLRKVPLINNASVFVIVTHDAWITLAGLFKQRMNIPNLVAT